MHPAQRQPGRGAAARHPDRDHEDIRQAERHRRGRTAPRVRDRRERDAQREEQAEARGHAPAAATVDSTAAITEICRGVAPSSRIAANRCSRRAADSLVAVATKISTGASRASATAEKMKSMPLARSLSVR